MRPTEAQDLHGALVLGQLFAVQPYVMAHQDLPDSMLLPTYYSSRSFSVSFSLSLPLALSHSLSVSL